MSRLKKLQERRKNRKIKNILKATSYFLALTLFAGSVQSLGTYALFIDTEDVPSSIQLSTGDVDIEINKGTELTDIAPNDEKALPIEIKNNGTLHQNIKLDLSMSDEIKDYIDYDFDLSNGVTVNKENGVLYKDGKLFSLEPDSCVTGSVNITLKEMNKNKQNELAGKTHNVDLKVKSTQISKNDEEVFNDGFYDEVIQKNTVTVVEGQVITVAVGEKAHYINDGGNRYTSLYIPVNVNGLTPENKDDVNVSVTIQNSKGSYKGEYVEKGNFKYIKIMPQNAKYIEFQDGFNITITIQVGNEEAYSQLCWVKQDNASNSNCAEDNHPAGEPHRRCQIQIVNAGHRNWNTLEERPIIQDIESSKEDIEASNKPEVVLPPKEDVEIPNKPEVVEPSKEDVEVPSQPEVEVVQPPIEN